MNLGDAGDGMVPLDTKPKLEQPSTSFVDENLIEKNVSQQQETTMDSTPIADLMAPQAGAGAELYGAPGHGSGRSQPRRFAVYVRSSDRCWVLLRKPKSPPKRENPRNRRIRIRSA
jgi:hypothetical protein